jgi:hypothetical protein
VASEVRLLVSVKESERALGLLDLPQVLLQVLLGPPRVLLDLPLGPLQVPLVRESDRAPLQPLKGSVRPGSLLQTKRKDSLRRTVPFKYKTHFWQSQRQSQPIMRRQRGLVP